MTQSFERLFEESDFYSMLNHCNILGLEPIPETYIACYYLQIISIQCELTATKVDEEDKTLYALSVDH